MANDYPICSPYGASTKVLTRKGKLDDVKLVVLNPSDQFVW